MSRKFTAREKVLMYILGCITALTLIVVFLFMPGMEKLSATGEKLDAAKIKEEEAKSAVYRVEKLEGQLGQIKGDISNLSSVYYNTMEPEEADVILSGIVSRYGFTPLTLEIMPVETVTLQTYAPCKIKDIGLGGTTPDSDTSSEESKDAAPDYALNSYTMTITATGNNNQFPALCSEISSNHSMHLISYSLRNVVSEEEVPTNSQTNTNDNDNINDRTNSNSRSNSNADTSGSVGSILSGLLSDSGVKTVTKNTYEISIVVEMFTYKDIKSLANNNQNSGNETPSTNESDVAPGNKTPGIITNNEPANTQTAATAAPTDTTTANNEKKNNTTVADTNSSDYILNSATGYFHVKTCSKVGQMAQENKRTFLGSTVKDMKDAGYKSCNECLSENG